LRFLINLIKLFATTTCFNFLLYMFLKNSVLFRGVELSTGAITRLIFGPKRDEVTGGWRKLHNEELHNLYSSPNIIRMITSRRMRLAGHVARMGRR
jgi:hypothetical protein